MKHKEYRVSDRQLGVTHKSLEIIMHCIVAILHTVLEMLVICRDIILEEVIRLLEESLGILKVRKSLVVGV